MLLDRSALLGKTQESLRRYQNLRMKAEYAEGKPSFFLFLIFLSVFRASRRPTKCGGPRQKLFAARLRMPPSSLSLSSPKQHLNIRCVTRSNGDSFNGYGIRAASQDRRVFLKGESFCFGRTRQLECPPNCGHTPEEAFLLGS